MNLLVDEVAPAAGESQDEIYIFPMSYSQQRLWFLDQLAPGSAAYNMPVAVQLTGKLAVTLLAQSLNALVARHEVLRTTFALVDGEPAQVVAPTLTVELPLIDLSMLPSNQQQVRLATLATQEAQQPFTLETGPLLRASLIRLQQDDHVLLLTLHHIIADGWSMRILIGELGVLYTAFATHEASPLPDLPIQYADFACWQRQWLQGEVLEEQIDYWKEQLKDAPTLLELPTDLPRPPVQSQSGARHAFHLDKQVSQAIKQLAQQTGATLFMTLLAAYNVLLARYSNQTDIVVGAPVANRNRQEVEPLIGFFVNTLILRSRLDENPTFLELLQQVRQSMLGALQQQDLPFELLVDALQPTRNLSHTPLFQVMFVWQEGQTLRQTIDNQRRPHTGLQITPLEVANSTAKFDLTLFMDEGPQGLTGVWEYSTDLFSPATIERMAGHFQTLLTSIVADPTQQVAHLALLTPAERHHLLVDLNQTTADYPDDQCLYQWFERQVEQTPAAEAVVFGAQRLTYQQLNGRANQLAHYLQRQGVGPEVLVGVCCERSLELMIGILAVLKAGGAYVPLDPFYPAERLAYMLEDAQVKVVLTQQHLLANLPTAAPTFCLDSQWQHIRDLPSSNPVNAVQPDNLAYVIYTSGSTGRPKGAQIIQRGLMNYLAWAVQAYRVSEGAGAPVHSSIGFDATITSFFSPLLVGKKVVFVPEKDEIEALSSLLQTADHYSLVKITPAHMEALGHLLPKAIAAEGADAFVIGGEALFGKHLAFWQEYAPRTRMINEYGPTETVVGCCVYEALPGVNYAGAVPIGRPIANTQLYVLDAHQQLTPYGVPGELYIGGAGVARGYLNRPDLTAERFIENPFGAGRLYKTGDLVRYLPDGNLVYLGRLDHQVKIRGFRIELSEIEAVLTQHEEVQEAVVIVDEQHGHKRLIAYVVGGNVQPASLRQFLQARLPDYMLPAVIIPLDALPLTNNGKVDRRALPAPQAGEMSIASTFAAPRTTSEVALAEIWQSVLRVERVGIHDNFFELGGDSILSIQVVSRARQAGWHLTPKQLFQQQTIAGLASLIDVAAAQATPVAEQGVVLGSVALTPIQHWFFEQERVEAHHYNQALLLKVAPTLSPVVIEQALQHLLQHHDALRLRFVETAAGWQQYHAAPDQIVPFSVSDLAGLPTDEQRERIEAAARQAQSSLHLSNGPLLRATLLQLEADQPARLLLVIHHLAVDGVSWRILLEDLATACTQIQQGQPLQLPAKTTSFQAWAHYLNDYAQSPKLMAELPHWLAQTRPLPALPLDQAPTGANTVASALDVTRSLSLEQTQALLQRAPAAYHTQINDLLLTALAQTLAEWTGASTCLVDLESHGRAESFEAVDLSRTVGWFTAIYPTRLRLPDAGLGAAIKSMKEQLRHVPHQGVGYGVLRYLRQHPDLAKVACAQVKFNYLGRVDNSLHAGMGLAEEAVGPEHSPRAQRTHWLDVAGVVLAGRLRLTWTYSQNLHQAETIERLAQRLVEHLNALIDHCLQPDAGGYTPSDFPLAPIDQAGVDRLVGSRQQVADLYALSPMQQGMLFHTLLAPQSGVYFEQMSTRLHGQLDAPRFRRAWQAVVDAHAILRTEFYWEGLEQPVQLVRRQVDLPWQEEDWRGIATSQQEARLAALLQRERTEEFDLHQAPLMRCRLIRLASESYQFVWNHHHLLLDGWCRPLLIQEVLAHYAGNAPGAVVLPYRNYIAWLQQQDQAEAARYWQQALQGISAPTPLMVDRPVPTKGENSYAELPFALDAIVTATLQTLARQHHLTLNTFVQGAWSLLLSRYSGQADVLFGATVSGRPPALAGVETMIGLFINTLPVRVQVKEEETLLSWLQTLQAEQREREQFSHSPLVDIQGWSEIPRGIALFESLVVFENYPAEDAAPRVAGITIAQSQFVEQTNYPLTVVAAPGRELWLAIDYDTQRFDAATIQRMGGHLQTLLAGMALAPTQRLLDLPLLTVSETEQLLVEWAESDADCAYPTEKCVHELFAEQAARTPAAIALAFAGQSLRYDELNQRANQLAHYLQQQIATTVGSTGSPTVVAICMARSLEMLISVLAVLKAGYAYLPLDPNQPSERLAMLIDDAQASIVLTQHKLIEQLPTTSQAICVENKPNNPHWSAISQQCCENPTHQATPASLAYLIYTSGSTGKPKGVLVSHLSLVEHACVTRDIFGLAPSQAALLFANLSFDQSVEDIFSALISGGKLVIRPAGDVLSLADLLALVETEQVTVLNIPMAYWQEWTLSLAQYPVPGCVRLVIIGGETVSLETLGRWQREVGTRVQWCNGYGPTEATVTATLYYDRGEIDPISRSVPIGRPLPNTPLYILDRYMRPVPIGVPGDLYIGGIRVAQGYKDRPELTAEKFIANPFGAGRLYKTGDLVRYLRDGNIEFIGRQDHQVKIRGFRIELGEIEAALSQHPAVRSAVVVVRTEGGIKQLVAYVVADCTLPELRFFLQEQLPDYMIPAAFVWLEAMPINSSGKIDRRALPAPKLNDLVARYVAPREAVEQRLATLWAEVLGVPTVSIDDNFFDLGGHSLLAVRLMAGVQQAFGQNLPLSILFEQPTVADLAKRVRQAGGTNAWSPLVTIQPHGDKTPFFCVHGGGGNVLHYYALARALGSEQPFYGLQAVGLDGEQAPFAQIEAMAAHYIATIRRMQPHGPYLLGGHSFGGHVAYAMAQQLQHAGERVALVAVMDTYAPGAEAEPVGAGWDDAQWLLALTETIERFFAVDLALDYAVLQPMPVEVQLALVCQRLAGVDLLPTGDDTRLLGGLLTVFRANNQIDYRPSSVLPTPLALFRASEANNEAVSAALCTDPCWGWQAFAEGAVDLHWVPGDHVTMLATAQVSALAEQLAACLQRAL